MQLIENLTGTDFSEAYMNDLKELCLLVVELHLKLTQVLHLKVTHLEEPEYGSSVLGFSSFCLLGFLRRAVFEAVAIVAGFNDVAVMSQPVE